jgi:site-specific recombinase XerD
MNGNDYSSKTPQSMRLILGSCYLPRLWEAVSMAKSKMKRKRAPKSVLKPSDLEQSKSAVLNSLTSPSSQRTYDHAIREFIEWYCSEPRLAFNKTVVTRYRISLEQQHYASTTINLRLAAVRRLAYEAADCGLLSADLAAGIRRVKGAKRLSMPVGNWLSAEQGKRLLRTVDNASLRGKRDYATLAILLGCGLRRAELTALRVEDIQQREEHWVSADLIGKGGHIRTIPVPDWVKAGIDVWMAASGVADGILLRSINKAGRVWGCGFSPKVIWGVVKERAMICEIPALAPHDLRRTCARLCHQAGGELDQIQFNWGMDLCKQRNDTSDANSASTTRSIIGLGLNRIRRDSRRIRLASRRLGADPFPEIICIYCFATHLFQAGASLRMIQLLLVLADFVLSTFYLHLSQPHLC